ncbi:hypothetical protein AX16_003667 [Volvariella volvacea WC 439]|nr:hypothetical protein AX16_003667 [Volvariella volvacea WC 439]
MSSPIPDENVPISTEPEDDPMNGSGQEEDGEGEEVRPNMLTDDSSEEGEDDEEEAKAIREGFIVEDEEEDEEDEEEEERRKRRKRRKRNHRREEEEGLEEDDLELLAENTGMPIKKNKRLRRLGSRGSESPVASSSKRRVIESSDEDLDHDDQGRDHDIQKIWDDDRGREDYDEDAEDMEDFIEYEDAEEEAAMNEEERQERRKKERQMRKARGLPPELTGIDASAWDELHEVFGDGHDYDWALIGDEELDQEMEQSKPEMSYSEVFEPSEIRKRFLTEDDDLIRAQDMPERMQLATSSLSDSATLSVQSPFTEEHLDEAAMWVTTRLSPRKTREFFTVEGQYQHYKGDLVMSVTQALRFLFVEEYEVPYVWANKRDYLCRFDPMDIRSRFELLNSAELWKIYTLGQKYRALLERKRVLHATYPKYGVTDEYYEMEILPQIDSVEVVSDTTEWLALRYKDKKQEEASFQFHDDEMDTTKRRKMPSRVSAYELAKKSIVSRLAQGFGIQPHQVVINFLRGTHDHFVEDLDLNPIAYAEQFVSTDGSRITPEELLARARLIIATELGKDPLLRNEMRKLFKEEARISVQPTERGIAKIDEHHPYFNFKYLYNKSIKDMLETSQFLNILTAESEHLVTVSIFLPSDLKTQFERRLTDAFASDAFSDSARAWNEERMRVVQEVLEQHLLPAGVKWTWEYLREEVEDYLATQCAEHLRKRIDAAPFKTDHMRYGDVPTVLSASWGKGDPQKDVITLVLLDENGELRECTKMDNLHDTETVDEFIDLLKKRKPDVVVIGGFSMATTKLIQRVKELLRDGHEKRREPGPNDPPLQPIFDIPVIQVFDDVARIYQHSERDMDEYSTLSPIEKYCLGLARYVQSPLNEYAALGADIAAVTFEEDDQHLVPKEKLLVAFERVLVDVTNAVGVDINRTVTNSYYRHLLPFVCGLGPRKAQALVKKIGGLGGTLTNRDQFIRNGLLTTKIFLNAASFLKITQAQATAEDYRVSKHQYEDEDASPDPLDKSRIHPEDYELARKMATDALELDEEDIHDEHPSHVVSLLAKDPDNERKLAELNLDEFAISLYEANNDQKRHTLNVIREELLRPFMEQRKPFVLPTPWEVLTMLSGETPRTLRVGLIVSCLVLRPKRHFAVVRLDSGIEGIINARYIADGENNDAAKVVSKGQTIQGIIIDHQFPGDSIENILVELSARQSDLANGDDLFRRVRHDIEWDDVRYKKDQEVMARKKQAEVNRTRRVIKHPNFHNFNTTQAEAYLENQQRGDVVIRPSSKGLNHLAVTWKVDDKLYQHIDVTEPNPDPTGQTTSGQLVVDANHTYADLDELIVNHVQAMARRVEELMASDKFKPGTEDDLHLFLKNFLAANPAKSMYGFTLNRKKPGHFSLCFLANKNSSVQTWPVRVAPEAYYLFDAAAVGVPELCDAFKVRHLHESQNLANAAGGKTPFGAGARTPARPAPGGATPGQASVRRIGQTPNPYGGRTPARYPGPAPSSAYGMPPQTPYGYQTPSHRPPSGYPPQPPVNVPPGVNPRPPPMMNAGGWQGTSGWS